MTASIVTRLQRGRAEQPRASIAHHRYDLDSSEEGKEERWPRGRRNPLKRLKSRKQRSWIFLPPALIFLPQGLDFPSPGLDFPSAARMVSATGARARLFPASHSVRTRPPERNSMNDNGSPLIRRLESLETRPCVPVPRGRSLRTMKSPEP